MTIETRLRSTGSVTGVGGGVTVGTTVFTGGTLGSVLFIGASSVVQQDNANFFWDDTNNELLLGTTSTLSSQLGIIIPSAAEKGIVIRGAASQSGRLIETQDSAGNYLTTIEPSVYTIRPAANSTGALIVQQAGTTTEIFRVDSTNGRISVGPIVPSYPVHLKSGGAELGFPTSTFPAADSWAISSEGNPASGIDFRTRLTAGGAAASRFSISGDGEVLVTGFPAAFVGLNVRGAAAQSANLQVWQNSSSLILGQIDANGAFVFNEQGADADCRVEGDTDVNLIYTDASTDRVGIGTAAPATKLDVNGTITCTNITTGLATVELDAGTYTPTRSAEVNMDANVTMTQAQYLRVGATVTVSGAFTANPTSAAVATSFEITLPVTSNVGATDDVAGVAFSGAISGQGAEIIGVIANDTAKIQWISGDITSQSWSYTFSYQII